MIKKMAVGVLVLSLACVLGCKNKEQEVTATLPLNPAETTAPGLPVAPPLLPPAEEAKPKEAVAVKTTLQVQGVTPETGINPGEAAKTEEPAQEYQPTEKEIQQALKNAGLYEGEIDGKIGPKTTKAIEDFQAKNNLKVDGKVGHNTWKKLKEYLGLSSAASSQPGN